MGYPSYMVNVTGDHYECGSFEEALKVVREWAAKGRPLCVYGPEADGESYGLTEEEGEAVCDAVYEGGKVWVANRKRRNGT